MHTLTRTHTRPTMVRWVYQSMALVLALFLSTHAWANIDPKAAPPEFIQAVADQALEAVQNNADAQQGNQEAIDQLISQYVLPYVNFEKTTRLAAGRHWRQANEQQRDALVEAFKNTLVRTYSGALSKVDQLSEIKVQPFRGDPEAADVVVRSVVSQRSNPDVAVDYRMENTPEGWKIYDINIEGIWLIQNYRNQFSQVINEQGFDGLVDALNKQRVAPANQ